LASCRRTQQDALGAVKSHEAAGAGHRLRRSVRQRRHQARARTCHHQQQAAGHWSRPNGGCRRLQRPLDQEADISDQARAIEPEGVTRLVVERLNAGDAAGVAALYEPEAVLAYPADRPTTGREAIQAVYQQMVDAGVRFGIETPLPTVWFEDLALTSTPLGGQHRRPRAGAAPPARRLVAADHRPPRGPTAIAAAPSSTDHRHAREITTYGWSPRARRARARWSHPFVPLARYFA
jgi:SnoaL-like domain